VAPRWAQSSTRVVQASGCELGSQPGETCPSSSESCLNLARAPGKTHVAGAEGDRRIRRRPAIPLRRFLHAPMPRWLSGLREMGAPSALHLFATSYSRRCTGFEVRARARSRGRARPVAHGHENEGEHGAPSAAHAAPGCVVVLVHLLDSPCSSWSSRPCTYANRVLDEPSRLPSSLGSTCTRTSGRSDPRVRRGPAEMPPLVRS
jgi:hypothetical protein